MVEMTVRYEVGRGAIETVTGDFVPIELGPLPRRFLSLKTSDGWRFISFGVIVDVVCDDIPEVFIVSLQHMEKAITMHRADFEHEIEQRELTDEPENTGDAHWGHG